ncbi:hypothetical protein GCM10009827_108780 [Dactylosporangium maewongense]|uniref:Uncharacterized protein n=1 Tax=Dactylosporangium maewongense TaxID=634393 RepID=A0ABP4NYF9_9ACTN
MATCWSAERAGEPVQAQIEPTVQRHCTVGQAVTPPAQTPSTGTSRPAARRCRRQARRARHAHNRIDAARIARNAGWL